MREWRRPRPAEPEPEEPVRRPAGVSNALLAREVTSLSMRKPPTTADLIAGASADYAAAMSAVYAWLDGLGTPVKSVPELVALASDLPFKRADGTAATVH